MSTSAVESQLLDINPLDESGEKNYQRLTRLIFRGRGRFTLAVIESDLSFVQSERLFERLKIDLAKQDLNLKHVRLDATRFELRDIPELNSKISPCDVILLTGWDETPEMYPEAGKPVSRPSALAWLNILREHFRSTLPVPMLVWCSPFVYNQMLEHAPDFFDFSIGIFVFKAFRPEVQTRFIGDESSRMKRPLQENFADMSHSSADTLYYEGLLLRNPDNSPRRASALIGLASALQKVHDVNPTPRLQRSIALLKEAVATLSPEVEPNDWARAQNYLGIAHRNLPSGDRDANLRRAIECYESALRVRTEAAFPQEWATTQNNLGNAYLELNDPVLAKSHFENAVRGYIAAGIPPDWKWRAYAERRVRELSYFV